MKSESFNLLRRPILFRLYTIQERKPPSSAYTWNWAQNHGLTTNEIESECAHVGA